MREAGGKNWHCLRRGWLPLGLHKQELDTKKYIEIEYIKRYEKVKQNDRDKTKKSQNWHCLRRGRLTLGLHRQELKKRIKNLEIHYTKNMKR